MTTKHKSSQLSNLSPLMAQIVDSEGLMTASVMGTSSGSRGGKVLLHWRFLRIQRGKPSRPDTRSRTPARMKQLFTVPVVSSRRPESRGEKINTFISVWLVGWLDVVFWSLNSFLIKSSKQYISIKKKVMDMNFKTWNAPRVCFNYRPTSILYQYKLPSFVLIHN